MHRCHRHMVHSILELEAGTSPKFEDDAENLKLELNVDKVEAES